MLAVGCTLEIDRKSLKKMFPNLAKELGGDENKVQIDSARTDLSNAEESLTKENLFTSPKSKLADKFRNYNPTVEDFIRRCDTEAQAEEIVSYLLNRDEISVQDAEKIRRQLRKDGVRSFGPKKEDNYYFKESGIC